VFQISQCTHPAHRSNAILFIDTPSTRLAGSWRAAIRVRTERQSGCESVAGFATQGVLSALAPAGGYQSLWGTLLLVFKGMKRDAVPGMSINGRQASV
jgi:hypothetical protein